MKKRMSWYWAVPGTAGLALVMAAVLLLVSTAGRTPTASAQTGCVLSVTKVADVGIAPEGSDITYDIRVTNTGTVQCTNVEVADQLVADLDCISTTQNADFTTDDCVGDPGQLITWEAATLDVDETGTLTMVARLGAGATDGETVANTAAASADQGSTGDSDSWDVVINDCDLSISKDADPDDEVGEGGEIVYTITVDNDGGADCNDVVITEDIPGDTDCIDTGVTSDSDLDEGDFDVDGCDASGEVTWDGFDLDNGDRIEVEMTVELTSGAEDGDDIDNTACVTSDDTDEDVEICDTMTVDVEGVAATKTPTRTVTPQVTATVQALPTVIAPPPPVPTVRATIAPPITGTGSDGSSRPLAATLGLVGAALLLVSGGVLVKRTR